ncbi:MAG: cyclic nucleotide-binding domain-containing protein [Acidimicrobiia bacterium]
MAGAPTDYLADVPLFGGLSRGDLQLVAQAGDQIRAEAGSELVTEGRVGREFFLILDGEATVRRDDSEVATLGPGEYFGELSLLHRGPRSATVIANTDMTLFVLGQREFAGLVDSAHGLAAKLLTGLAQRLREADATTYTH